MWYLLQGPTYLCAGVPYSGGEKQGCCLTPDCCAVTTTTLCHWYSLGGLLLF
jgi:hypothetical protein